MALTKSQREQQKVEDEYRRQTSQLAAKPEYASPCSKHPEWRVEITGQRIAPTHAGLCPQCRDETLEQRNPGPAPVRKLDPGSAGLENDLRYELWRQRHPSKVVESGSFEEGHALDAIAQARYEEEEKDAARDARRGVLVSARPIDGRWVETRRLGNRYVTTGPES